jgi:hypothetical protein
VRAAVDITTFDKYTLTIARRGTSVAQFEEDEGFHMLSPVCTLFLDRQIAS